MDTARRLQVGHYFPPGTEVGAYNPGARREQYPPAHRATEQVGAPPEGPPITSGTVDESGFLTLNVPDRHGPSARADVVLHGVVDGRHIYSRMFAGR